MSNDLAHQISILKAEIIQEERTADEIAGLARFLKQAGHHSPAASLFAVGRQLRIKALDLRGSLATLCRFNDDDSV